ncbi:hypothetical protein SAMN05421820_107137 [Pedobacter steynii]|uniref:Uncharacterized protein n=1 Tax=Pedobacter steynii TaxID=430522 RepID=A0A1H0AM28_9SPHI|nr:hypothetical protein [Pedobacter steynii]NQX41321.1 hypothetical protein [Pedobacter steynii]SDN34421.1 hypothetical protein SAMN05421820_107137 [Pedobacter steynii]
MLPKLNYIQKNKLLLPLLGIGLLLSWFLAFSKTFDAIMLHRKLNAESAQKNDISFNPVYVQRKLEALDRILKGYLVGEDWNDLLWMRGSEIAARQNVGIEYSATKISTETDSTTLGKAQSLKFYGNFVQLVKLIDTLERSSKIGKISALQFNAPKPDLLNEQAGKNVLRLDFKGLSTPKSVN